MELPLMLFLYYTSAGLPAPAVPGWGGQARVGGLVGDAVGAPPYLPT